MLDQIEFDELLYLENGYRTTHSQDEEGERDHNPYEKNDVHRFFCPPSLNSRCRKWNRIKRHKVSS